MQRTDGHGLAALVCGRMADRSTRDLSPLHERARALREESEALRAETRLLREHLRALAGGNRDGLATAASASRSVE